MLGLGGDRAGVVERERIRDARLARRDRDRPRAAVLQELAVLDVRVADRPIRKEGARFAHRRGLGQKRRDRAVDIRLADDRDALFIQKRVRRAGHDAELALQGVPALDLSLIHI